MKLALVVVIFVLVAGACAAPSDIVVTDRPASSGPDIASDAAVTDEPDLSDQPDMGGQPPEPTVDDDLPAVEAPPDRHLLQADDLPGWEYVRAMAFSDEPSFEAIDCPEMADVWAPHRGNGERVRAAAPGVSIRQAVVTMEDEAAALAVLDAVDIVWETCPLIELDIGESWWLEPVEIAATDGWRTAALAIGVSDELIWTIGYWQQGATIVMVDIDAQRPWDLLPGIFGAVRGRVLGDPVPFPAPEPAPVPGTAPTVEPAIEPTPTAAPSPSPTPRPNWRADDLAVYVPDPSLFGEDYELDYGSVQEAEAADPDDRVEGCDTDPPSDPGGINVSYSLLDDGTATDTQIVVQLGTSDPVVLDEIMDAFRTVLACDLSTEGLETWAIVTDDPDGETLVLEWSATESGTFYFHRVGLATTGELLVAVNWIYRDRSDQATIPADAPSAETIIGWMDEIAASDG